MCTFAMKNTTFIIIREKMKKIYVAAMASMLLAAPVAEPAVAAIANSQETLTPVKKTKKKSTAKKSTNKKATSTKKATTTTTTTTTTEKSVATEQAETNSQNSGQSVIGSVLGGLLGGNNSAKTESSSSKGSAAALILGGLLGGSSASDSNDNGSSAAGLEGILSGLTTIFDASKTATADKLVGTWTYQEPAVVFESDNVLKKIGGKVASATIEKKLQEQFSKVGIEKGMMKMTFDKDGNFTQTIGSKTLSGTYTVSDKQVKLNYGGNMQQLLGTTQLDGNDLLIVMDVSKLLKYAGAIGSLTGNSTASALGSLLSSYKGMEVGVKLQK